MSGPEMVTRLREREKEERRQRIPVVGMSANTSPADVKQYLRGGMDGFLMKPMPTDPQAVASACMQAMRHGTALVNKEKMSSVYMINGELRAPRTRSRSITMQSPASIMSPSRGRSPTSRQSTGSQSKKTIAAEMQTRMATFDGFFEGGKTKAAPNDAPLLKHLLKKGNSDPDLVRHFPALNPTPEHVGFRSWLPTVGRPSSRPSLSSLDESQLVLDLPRDFAERDFLDGAEGFRL